MKVISNKGYFLNNSLKNESPGGAVCNFFSANGIRECFIHFAINHEKGDLLTIRKDALLIVLRAFLLTAPEIDPLAETLATVQRRVQRRQ